MDGETRFEECSPVEVCDELQAALEEIAKQHTSEEMDDDDEPDPDYEGGYDVIVELARAALPEAGG